MKKALLLAGLFVPTIATAHVKWFVEDAAKKTELHLTDPAILVWIGVCIVLVSVALLLERALTPPSRFLAWVKTHKDNIINGFSIVIGAHMVLTIILGHLIAPTFEIDGPVMQVAAALATIAAASLIICRGRIIVGPLIMAIYVMVGITNGWDILEHLHFLGIGYFFGMIELSRRSPYAVLNDWALPALRVTLGISLVLLGLREKLLNPDLGLVFLQTHDWNFMQMLELEWFDDTLFIISAGMTELLFGVIYLTGAITRINTIVLTVFFTTTAFILGPKELNGHLTLVAVAVLFILLGSGDKLKIPVRRA